MIYVGVQVPVYDQCWCSGSSLLSVLVFRFQFMINVGVQVPVYDI